MGLKYMSRFDRCLNVSVILTETSYRIKLDLML